MRFAYVYLVLGFSLSFACVDAGNCVLNSPAGCIGEFSNIFVKDIDVETIGAQTQVLSDVLFHSPEVLSGAFEKTLTNDSGSIRLQTDSFERIPSLTTTLSLSEAYVLIVVLDISCAPPSNGGFCVQLEIDGVPVEETRSCQLVSGDVSEDIIVRTAYMFSRDAGEVTIGPSVGLSSISNMLLAFHVSGIAHLSVVGVPHTWGASVHSFTADSSLAGPTAEFTTIPGLEKTFIFSEEMTVLAVATLSTHASSSSAVSATIRFADYFPPQYPYLTAAGDADRFENLGLYLSQGAVLPSGDCHIDVVWRGSGDVWTTPGTTPVLYVLTLPASSGATALTHFADQDLALPVGSSSNPRHIPTMRMEAPFSPFDRVALFLPHFSYKPLANCRMYVMGDIVVNGKGTRTVSHTQTSSVDEYSAFQVHWATTLTKGFGKSMGFRASPGFCSAESNVRSDPDHFSLYYAALLLPA